MLLLDSDVIFITHPAQLVHLGHTETNRIVLLRDYEDSYSIDRADAPGWFGVELPECINSGLGVIPTHLVDLPFLDRENRKVSGTENGSLPRICPKSVPDTLSTLEVLFFQPAWTCVPLDYGMSRIPWFGTRWRRWWINHHPNLAIAVPLIEARLDTTR